MSRWRETKKKIHNPASEKASEASRQTSLSCAYIPNRIKAFLVDMFLIMMPIMYVTAYIIMDGKDDFQGSETARWVTSLIFGLIVIFFWQKNGQTPGSKAYELKVVHSKTGEILSWKQALIRYVLFIVSAVSIAGLLVPFFRKDRKTLHDLLSNSCMIDLQ